MSKENDEIKTNNVESSITTNNDQEIVKEGKLKKSAKTAAVKAKETTKKFIINQLVQSIKLFSLSNFKRGIKRFTIPSIVLSFILILIFIILNLVDLSDLTGIPLYADPVRILYSILIAIFLTIAFFFIGTVVSPQLGNFLVTNKFAIMLMTKGNKHYFEKLTEKERKIKHGHIISKLITLILTWASVSTALISIFLSITGDDNVIAFLSNNSDMITVLIRILIILILTPLILSFMIPMGWFLLDVKLKAFDTRSKTCWYVGTKVDRMLRNIITIGSMMAALGTTFGDLLAKVTAVLQIFTYSFVISGLAGVITILLYYILFSGGFYDIFLTTINVPFGITHLEILDEEKVPTQAKNTEKEEENQEKTNEKNFEEEIT